MWAKRRQGLIIICVLIIIATAYWAYTYMRNVHIRNFDPFVSGVFAHAARVKTYTQYVETTQVSDNGTLQITGEYLVDDAHKNYSSYSTTTYRQKGGQPVVFLLENRTIGSDVYVRVLNKSPLVKLSVPASGEWQHFPASNIPVTYQNIAVAGPVIDGLKLLGDGGAYLIQDTNHGTTSLSGRSLIRYTLRLSRLAEISNDGGIQTISGRVGNGGLIDLWIDASSSDVVHMRLTNGSSYTSTTTFSRFNEPLDIEAPTGQ